MALIDCPQCGKQISDLSSKCIHCGYQLKQPAPAPEAAEPAAPVPVSPAWDEGVPAPEQPAAKPPLSPEKKKRFIIIGAIAAAVVIIAVVLIIVLTSGGKKDTSSSSEPVTTQNMLTHAGFNEDNPNLPAKIYNDAAEFVQNITNPAPGEGNFFTKLYQMSRPSGN